MSRRALAPPQDLNGTIRKFEPAYWYINFPIPVTGALITTGPNSLRLVASFHRNKDNLALVWESRDTKDHPLFSYEFSRNYRDVVLSFDYAITGDMRLMDHPDGPTITATDDLGNQYFVRLWNYATGGSTGSSGTIVLDFNNVKGGEAADIDIPWERIDELFIFWIPDHYGIGRGKTTGTVANGATSVTTTVPNGVPISAGDIIRIKGDMAGDHVVTSNTTGPTQTVTFTPPVNTGPSGVAIPSNTDVVVETVEAYPIPYSSPNRVEAEIELTNISVTGGNHLLGINTTGLDAHPIRMTDGYDNAYPFAPERIVNQIMKLGYREWYNIYIGISHHHHLQWNPATEKYEIDLSGGFQLAPAAQAFFEDLYDRLHTNGFKIITSVSFEILDQLCPADWAQRDANGEQALTGWSPSSTLVSPASTDGVNYLRDVFLEMASIADTLGAPVYFQIGEPWYWDGSFSGGAKRPFIYDDNMQALYLSETGLSVPTPFIDDVADGVGSSGAYLDWCRQKLGEAGLYLRDEVLASYPSATSLILIFTPQFLGTNDPVLRRINLPVDEWKAPAFDILQVEDYDKIVEGDYNFTTDETIRCATELLEYDLADTQYFVGFNLFTQTTWIWYNIDRALWHIRDVAFAERYVWSREQVLRDGWVYGREAWKFFPELTTLAACWKITRVDGTVHRFTTHDKSITFDGETYSPANSYLPGDVEMNVDGSANQMEVWGITSDEITEADLLLGLYEHAYVEIFLVDYTDLTIPKTILQVGWIGQVTTQQDHFQADLRGLVTRLTQGIGETVAPDCRWDLGDERCQVNVAALTVSDTVDSVPGLSAEALSRPASSGSEIETVRQSLVNPNDEFIVFSRPEAAGYFDFGTVTWTSGDNAGLSMEVIRFQDGSFKLIEGMPFQIQVGDAFTVFPGCDKRPDTCKTKFNNFDNNGGFPHVPGTDNILEFPNSRSG